MTPPQATSSDVTVEGDVPAAVSFRVDTLTRRADFLHVSRGKRQITPGFIVQMRKRRDGEASGVRVGFTCSKKVGNAVARNRAKRRLREVARKILPTLGRNGTDYVLIGRHEATAKIPFDVLLSDFTKALSILHGQNR